LAFYGFRLIRLDCKDQRGKLQDDVLTTFSVFVNQVERGRGAATFPDTATGSTILAAALGPRTGNNMSSDWTVGPLELAPNDVITIVYSGQNTSDSQLSDEQAEQVELKVLDTVVSSVVGAAGLGAIGSGITGLFGLIGDPVGKFLGWSPQGPCNGLIFQDTIQFTGQGIEGLTFGPRGLLGMNDRGVAAAFPVDRATECPFTRSYTDQATHDESVCGHIAEYDVTYSVLQVPYASVTVLASDLYFPGTELKKGLRQLAPQHSEVSVRSLLRLRE
jgi:hypothetical protein